MDYTVMDYTVLDGIAELKKATYELGHLAKDLAYHPSAAKARLIAPRAEAIFQLWEGWVSSVHEVAGPTNAPNGHWEEQHNAVLEGYDGVNHANRYLQMVIGHVGRKLRAQYARDAVRVLREHSSPQRADNAWVVGAVKPL